MCGVDHVDCFHLGGISSAPPHVRTLGLIVIVAVQPLVLVFGVYFAGLFKNPTISVGMIGLFVWGAMYLARMVEYAVQAGWSLIVPFVGLLPLAAR